MVTMVTIMPQCHGLCFVSVMGLGSLDLCKVTLK